MTTSQIASEAATQYLARPEGRIAYDVQGTGPLLLLVPGMGDLRSSYRHLTPALVAAGYTVVTADLRGHGESDASFTSYGDVDTAGDIEALLRALGQPAVIVGNSMAAGSAVIVAAAYPELVTGLVLIGPYVREPRISAAGRLMFRVLMARPWVASVWKAYLPTLYAGSKPADFAEYRQRVVRALQRPGYTKAFNLTTRTSHVPAGESVAGVHTPTLVVMGMKDPDFKNPGTEADWIANALDGTAVMIPDSGHYPQSQQPDLVAAAMIDFLLNVVDRA